MLRPACINLAVWRAPGSNMGACCSQPSSKYEAGTTGNTKSFSKAPPSKTAKPAIPDFGLLATHEVIKLLGRGGEGETWLCRDRESGLEVAIKLIKRPIPKAALQVIKREIKIQADLGQGHLNIVSADEVILSKSYLGLIMEYVPGALLSNVKNFLLFVSMGASRMHQAFCLGVHLGKHVWDTLWRTRPGMCTCHTVTCHTNLRDRCGHGACGMAACKGYTSNPQGPLHSRLCRS